LERRALRTPHPDLGCRSAGRLDLLPPRQAKLRGGSKGLFRSKQARLEAHIKGSDFERLDLLPGDIRLRDNDLLLGQHPKAKRVMKRLLRPLQRDYELLLVDCPPSIGRSMEPFLATADVILVPVVPTTLALRMLERTEAFCEELASMRNVSCRS
jgi:chromosome partitioning protein